MNETFNIAIPNLIIFVTLLIIPILIFRWLKLPLVKKLLIAAGRMILQLSLVALYLEYIFKLDYLLVNFAWIIVMILAANITILNQSGLRFSKLFWVTFPSYIITTATVIAAFLIVFPANVISHSRYLIPLGGMLLGNLLRSNIVGMERFYSSLRERRSEYVQYLSLGATRTEAVMPFLRQAYKASIAPQIGGLATIGLVSLPGMMTGQILGGSSPAVAIKYQIMIMIAIFLTVNLSVLLSLLLSSAHAFDNFDRLKEDIYK
ncbi:MAG TPA: ABC transporter permease [Candidatus Cloacimonas sp.]|jgi:putative ABC transport system permease protein|nr:ABC transporter permease [Candidatus Cloacimonas sp.]